ncbi:MAG: helix-turn-helix transcriptional regulator [Alphaproteobacteria bacterium]|nr:helix-turn-helix transcriptional regulator [Alphaproteobacteria bacterium]
MGQTGGYGQFCPVAMASEILCSRWTMLILREFCAGSTRFNELRKGVPRMSPTLLTKRLKELEAAGVIARVSRNGGDATEYRLTRSGEDLKQIVMSVGFWGQRWVETRVALDNLDPDLLMWDMRRFVDHAELPRHKCTVRFRYSDLPSAKRHYWLVIENGQADMCSIDPGFDVDLYVQTDLRTMTSIWMGVTTVSKEIRNGQLELIGPRELCGSMQEWLGLSPFAKEKKQVA